MLKKRLAHTKWMVCSTLGKVIDCKCLHTFCCMPVFITTVEGVGMGGGLVWMLPSPATPSTPKQDESPTPQQWHQDWYCFSFWNGFLPKHPPGTAAVHVCQETGGCSPVGKGLWIRQNKRGVLAHMRSIVTVRHDQVLHRLPVRIVYCIWFAFWTYSQTFMQWKVYNSYTLSVAILFCNQVWPLPLWICTGYLS